MPLFTPAMKTFITAERFAVIGRVLTDRSRFDNKVLRWYQNHDLLVAPVKPSASPSETAETLSVLSDPLSLPDLSSTSISIIINPALGLPILHSLFPTPPTGSEPRAVWFQPDAASKEIALYVKERGIGERVVFGGPCILVLGEGLLAEYRIPRGKM